ncbi:ribonuclease III [Alteromonas oceanisediminis]|uniref:ribonuclease III n=1 Tax=Alteromonas oceanisediminis TaxID=2836180 RepID=UPI001BDAE527|nr:ribonuclease III [Alteromonas oceanisediminis]MBT0585801.1 ribonuclease III [Alteromonas oceanisediminis]
MSGAEAAVRHVKTHFGYTFQNPDTLTLALTHRSAAKQHNERLEFLGDAVLGMVTAQWLYEHFPKSPEGKLTRMRSSLVKGDTLAAIAKQISLGDFILLGPGEMKSGGHRRASILADAVEAIFGAIYMEAGFETCQEVILSVLAPRMKKLDPDEHPKDNKTRLQEFLQARKQPLPEYEVLAIHGQDHNQTFVVECRVVGLKQPIEGRGVSRRKAEQEAAQLAFTHLQSELSA